jgi:hypothetical protein
MTARKGGPLHRVAGNTFFVSMLVMAAFAIYLGFERPHELVNVFIGVFVFYLVATAWITIRRQEGTIGVSEKIGLAAALVLCAPFMIPSFQLALGLPIFFNSALPLKGPVLLAIYLFTLVLAIATGSDTVVVFSGGVSGMPRVARHLWRMCVALTLATGSAISNGLPRILPAAFRMPDWVLYLQFVWVALLFYWMVRVRLTGWAHPRAGETEVSAWRWRTPSRARACMPWPRKASR